jgi:excisionase family DNA binding protein
MAKWENYGDVMTVAQCAEILQIHKKLAEKLLRNNEIPGKKIGREWRIEKSDLQAYLSKKKSIGGFDNPKG